MFQGRLLLAFGTLAVAYASITGYVVYAIVDRALEDSLYRSHQSADDIWGRIWPSLFSTNMVLTLISLLIAVISVLLMCVWARRALRTIELDVRAIETGKPRNHPSVALAVWHQEADAAAEKLRYRFDRFPDLADKLEEALAAWETTTPDGRREARTQDLRTALTQSIDSLQATIQGFKY
ncbi:MAG: hypothetical protein L3K26_14675 [Candidatus Hydrogenedentes bacterium]|nr:hypothetical protein [Candidatus Hydrogenedentota bacterium]